MESSVKILYTPEQQTRMRYITATSDMADGIASGNMGVLMDGSVILGTGCYAGNHKES